MKKIYLPLVAIATLLSLTVTAQRRKMEFNEGNFSSRWSDPANWKKDGVQQTGSDGLPVAGDSVFISSGHSAYIGLGNGSGTYTYPTAGTLNNVIVIIQANASLQLGNGGQRVGVLNLDNASVISIEGSGASAGQIKANPNNDSRNKITIGGVIKYESDLTYNITPGSGPGLVAGPARATQFTNSGTNGFAFGTLPVVLMGFGANLTSTNTVKIDWNTQQEVNTDRFEVLRSSDGISWQTLATIKATGFSSTSKNYSFTDPAPQKGVNLYRLKTIDLDGNFGFSGVTNVHLDVQGKISVFPNPTINLVTVSLGEAPASDWTISLRNLFGQTVLVKKLGKDYSTASLNVSSFPAGNYSVEINIGSSKQIAKLVIAH